MISPACMYSTAVRCFVYVIHQSAHEFACKLILFMTSLQVFFQRVAFDYTDLVVSGREGGPVHTARQPGTHFMHSSVVLWCFGVAHLGGSW
jgi:hypothetical protein